MPTNIYFLAVYMLSLAGFLLYGYLSAMSLTSRRCLPGEQCGTVFRCPVCWIGFCIFSFLFGTATLALIGYLSEVLVEEILTAASFLGSVFAGYLITHESPGFLRLRTMRYALIFPASVYGLVFCISIFVLSLARLGF